MLFLLWHHPFILSGVISPLISSSILGTYWPGEFLFHCSIILPFHTVHEVLKARILKWFAIPFSSGHILSDLSTMTPLSWVAPQGMAWFHWVRQGCGPSVIWLASFLWVSFQCVCPLMPSCNTCHLTWVSLTLDGGCLLMAAPPDLESGVGPLGPPVPVQPPLLGRGVAPLGRLPWPWANYLFISHFGTLWLIHFSNHLMRSVSFLEPQKSLLPLWWEYKFNVWIFFFGKKKNYSKFWASWPESPL